MSLTMSLSFLPFARDSRLVLLSLGVASVGLLAVMRSLLEYIRDEAEIKPSEPKTQYITQETEDSLKLSTLETLLGHYNYAIRETSAKIVCDRAVNDGSTVNILLAGITKPNYDERMKNLRCLAIITDQQSMFLLDNRRAYRALVRSLELCLADQAADPDAKREKLDDPHFDDYYLRDMSEKLCLMFVSQLIERFTATELVRAQFVERWLAKQYWGDNEDEIQENYRAYKRRRENRITNIMKQVEQCTEGARALVRAKLLSRNGEQTSGGLRHGETHAEGNMRLSFAMSVNVADDGIGLTDDMVTDDADVAIPRLLEQSVEEQRLRHRHREAMVFNDGTRPLNRDDIIERNALSPR
jgi:hypothetical protein